MQVIDSLSQISGRYRVLFCDLWGCLHDGYRAFPDAVAALTAFRAGGGTVLLLTNSPRPRAAVARQLDKIGVPRDCWDVIASSGDSARAAMFQGVVGQKVFFIGEPTDLSFFEPPSVVPDPVPIERVPLDQAQGIVCTGPFDPRAPLEDLRPQLLYARQKGLKLLCANPDLYVDRGGQREFCAGAVAKLYEEMGGESLYFGKPHPPIYDLARARLAEIGRLVPEAQILAIGDGISTDIAGAMGEDIDSLFITGGLARAEIPAGPDGRPDARALEAWLRAHMAAPLYAMTELR